MNILFISPDLNYPPIYGGRIRRFNIIKQFSRHNDITLLSFFNKYEEIALKGKDESLDIVKNECFSGISHYCKNVFMVDRSKAGSFDRYVKFLPFLRIARKILSLYYSLVFIKKLKYLLKTKKIDLVWIEYWYMGKYRKYFKNFPVVLDEVDVEFVRWRQLYELEKDSKKRNESYRLWKETEKQELKIIDSFDVIVTVTDLDKKELQKYFPKKDYYVLPTAVDRDYFKPENDLPRKGCSKSKVTLIFVGSMMACFNQDAVLYFYNDIWPILKKKYSNIHFTIVGLSPPPKIKSLEGKNITVTGSVPDIRKYIYKSDIFIAPLTYGSGIKGKVLEAMAMGIPVVTTSVGVHGLAVEINKDVLVADSPTGFASKIIDIVNDRMLYQRLSQNGLNIIKYKYCWNMLGEKLNMKITDIVRKHK